MSNQSAQLRELLSTSHHIAILTGAGISAESGLRTFRGVTSTHPTPPPDMAALWRDFDPATLATPEAFERDPELVTRWYDWRRLGCLAAEPNAGHLALAELERGVNTRGGTLTLLTQNVDRLHHRAGSVNIVELHGSIIQWRCTRTGNKLTPPNAPMALFPPPSPFASGALLRPEVVWFGEALPEGAVAAAQHAAATCDLFLSIGTSSVVYPAASFIQSAARRGAKTVEINLEPTPISDMVDLSIRGKAGDVLPRALKG
ncbi:MAG: SIR2 family NAD-dependent protein deacylase [Phycisphaerales bacterium]